jgi:hypothetical protein
VWHVIVNAQRGQGRPEGQTLALRRAGERAAALEPTVRDLLGLRPASAATRGKSGLTAPLIRDRAGEPLRPEPTHTGVLQEGASYSTRLLACAAFAAQGTACLCPRMPEDTSLHNMRHEDLAAMNRVGSRRCERMGVDFWGRHCRPRPQDGICDPPVFAEGLLA